MKAWIKHKKLSPILLTKPNIPKPLHGINPRTIMGKRAWELYKTNAKIKTNFSCACCGTVTSKLELHENYDIDYEKGVMNVNSMEPLCNYCHMFIHSGLLLVFLNNGTFSKQKVVNILEHGITILSKNNLDIFIGTFNLAKKLKIDTKELKVYTPPKSTISWSSWCLIWEGKKYYGLTKKQWNNKYNGKV